MSIYDTNLSFVVSSPRNRLLVFIYSANSISAEADIIWIQNLPINILESILGHCKDFLSIYPLHCMERNSLRIRRALHDGNKIRAHLGVYFKNA